MRRFFFLKKTKDVDLRILGLILGLDWIPRSFHWISLCCMYAIRMRIDSTVLAYVMKTLNERYQYGLELFLLSIDEGITGYRDDSLKASKPLSLSISSV